MFTAAEWTRQTCEAARIHKQKERRFAILGVLLIGAGWIIVILWLWSKWLPPVQEARETMMRLESSLVAQRSSVDAALMIEAARAEELSSVDQRYRVEKLQRWQKLLHAAVPED
jgi:hypothetical protein